MDTFDYFLTAFSHSTHVVQGWIVIQTGSPVCPSHKFLIIKDAIVICVELFTLHYRVKFVKNGHLFHRGLTKFSLYEYLRDTHMVNNLAPVRYNLDSGSFPKAPK